MPLLSNQKLSLKQRKWIEAYLETGNATEAAMRVYNCKNRDVARNIGGQNVAKLSFDELMDGLGLSDHKILKKIDEGLNATKPLVIGSKVAKVEDYSTRHRYVETSLKLKGRLKPEDDGSANVTNNNVVMNILFYGGEDKLKGFKNEKGTEGNNDTTQLRTVPPHDSSTE